MSAQHDVTTPPVHTRSIGSGPQVMLVHGALQNAAAAWRDQLTLAADWRLELPDRRGYAPNPVGSPSDPGHDAEDLAGLLGAPAHLVGHSYGAIVALLIAARHPGVVRSLTLLEPPVHSLVRGEPAVEAVVAMHEGLRGLREPEAFHDGVLKALGVSGPRRPLREADRRHVLLMMGEPLPWQVSVPVDRIAATGVPTLVLSGGHDPVYERCADRLAEELAPNAVREVLAGAGHSVQRAPGFNARVERFWLAVGADPPRPHRTSATSATSARP